MNKLSLVVKNVRYLYKLLGTTSLSGIGDGTITNAISALNSNIAYYKSSSISWLGLTIGLYKFSGLIEIKVLSGLLSSSLTAYTKYTVGTITTEFRPKSQFTKIIIIFEGVVAMLNITVDGVIQITPYAALAKNYTPVFSEIYHI